MVKRHRPNVTSPQSVPLDMVQLRGNSLEVATETVPSESPIPRGRKRAGALRRNTERRMRAPNTTASGEPFDAETVEAVWRKAVRQPEFIIFRRDRYGALLLREKYGKRHGWGWEIDHIIPVSKGGTDELTNLQPLHWENNRRKGDS